MAKKAKPSYSIQVYNESQEIYWEGEQESKNEAIVRARYLVEELSKINWKASISATVQDYSADHVVTHITPSKLTYAHNCHNLDLSSK